MPVFPASAGSLAAAADAFDAVRYGHRPAGPRHRSGRRRARGGRGPQPPRSGRAADPGGGRVTTALREPAVDADAARPRRWDRARTRRTAAYGLVVGLGLVLVVLLALSAQRPTQPLDPQGPGPGGAMALAEVLRDQGVEVDVVRSIAALEGAAPDRSTTVLVGDTTTLGPGAAERLGAATRSAGRLVVVGGTTDQLDAVGLPVSSFPGGVLALPARCDSTIARDDDVASQTDVRYLADAGAPATACFLVPEGDRTGGDPLPEGSSGAAMVELPATVDHPSSVLVGFGSGWANGEITQDSNAGLAVRALGSTPRLLWYQPGPGDLTAPGVGETRAIADVWPVVDRAGGRPDRRGRGPPRARPRTPARAARARAPARRRPRRRDHREPGPPLPQGR